LNAASKRFTQIGIEVVVESGGFHTVRPLCIQKGWRFPEHPETRVKRNPKKIEAIVSTFATVLEGG
jgi:hypothetical protein